MSLAPTLAVTAGDPCGVGPEVILKTLAGWPAGGRAQFVIIGDHAVFEQTARRLHRRLPSWCLVRADAPWPSSVSQPIFIECGHRERFTPGRSSATAGRASLDYLDRALALWLAGRVHGIVTAPVTKWAIQRCLPLFVGQTEYFATATRTREVAMMFVSKRLRVVILTRHIPLRRVAAAITPRLLVGAVRLTVRVLQEQFRIQHPRIAFCGINPHAGDGGLAGTEEQVVMRPAIHRLRQSGVHCDGPFAADGFFSATPTIYDAIVCAYHDQGLIPFKMMARDNGCQLSVGLPFVRTSPDHGSALDIAGRGIADPGSMRYAMNVAGALVRQRQRSESA